MSAAIRLRSVAMRYGDVEALRGVDVEVPVGSLCGLIGPNGAGKTTTMRIVATDLQAARGYVEVLGAALPAESDAIRGRLGYMPEVAQLYPELTLEEYLAFFAALYGVRRADRAGVVVTAMEMAGVSAFARRRLVGLSKGERQRLLLARTLVNDPDLLILDEPADGLDPRGRVELRELLRLLHERGKTILISSHILSDLQEICSDFVFIDRGRVLFQGSRERLEGVALQQVRIRIELQAPDERAAALLGATAGLVLESSQGTRLQVIAPKEPAFARDLLRRLVGEGIAVVSFSRSEETLESAYLRMTAPRAEGGGK